MIRRTVRPTLRDRLHLGPEAHPFHAMLVVVAEGAALPAAEAVIGDRYRDRDVDADHADVDPLRELAGGMAVAGEDGDAVAILVLARQLESRLEIRRAHDLQHRSEDLVMVALHPGGDMIEQGRADKETFLMPLQPEAAAVDDQLGAFIDRGLDPVLDALLVHAV